jgi:hypothetical protein
MSAAIPCTCWEFGTPPTLALCFSQRQPLLIFTGAPKCVRTSSSTVINSGEMLSNPQPQRHANSLLLKCSLKSPTIQSSKSQRNARSKKKTAIESKKEKSMLIIF